MCCTNPSFRPKAKRQGFTLVEIMVALSVGMLIMGVLAGAIFAAHRTWEYNQYSNQNVGSDALAMFEIAHGGRGGAWGLRQASSATLVTNAWNGTSETGNPGWMIQYDLTNAENIFPQMQVYYDADARVLSNNVFGVFATNVVDSYIDLPTNDRLQIGIRIRRDDPSTDDVLETTIFMRN